MCWTDITADTRFDVAAAAAAAHTLVTKQTNMAAITGCQNSFSAPGQRFCRSLEVDWREKMMGVWRTVYHVGDRPFPCPALPVVLLHNWSELGTKHMHWIIRMAACPNITCFSTQVFRFFLFVCHLTVSRYANGMCSRFSFLSIFSLFSVQYLNFTRIHCSVAPEASVLQDTEATQL